MSFFVPCLPPLARSVLLVGTGSWWGAGAGELRTVRVFTRLAAGQSARDRKAAADLVCAYQSALLKSTFSVRLSHGGQPRTTAHVSRDLADLVSTRSVPDRNPPLSCHCPRCRMAYVLLQRHHGKGLLVNGNSTTLAGQSQKERKA